MSQLKRTPLKRGTSQLKRSWLKKKANKNEIPLANRKAVEARSGGQCEYHEPGLGRCIKPATEMHHIERRRGGNHEPSNILHLCRKSHLAIHASPKESYENGTMKRFGKDS